MKDVIEIEVVKDGQVINTLSPEQAEDFIEKHCQYIVSPKEMVKAIIGGYSFDAIIPYKTILRLKK